jgi:hypothetical protein
VTERIKTVQKRKVRTTLADNLVKEGGAFVSITRKIGARRRKDGFDVMSDK